MADFNEQVDAAVVFFTDMDEDMGFSWRMPIGASNAEILTNPKKFNPDDLDDQVRFHITEVEGRRGGAWPAWQTLMALACKSLPEGRVSPALGEWVVKVLKDEVQPPPKPRPLEETFAEDSAVVECIDHIKDEYEEGVMSACRVVLVALERFGYGHRWNSTDALYRRYREMKKFLEETS